jgi:hypothetical protein
MESKLLELNSLASLPDNSGENDYLDLDLLNLSERGSQPPGALYSPELSDAGEEELFSPDYVDTGCVPYNHLSMFNYLPPMSADARDEQATSSFGCIADDDCSEVQCTWEEEQPSSFSTDYLASDDRTEFSSSSPKVHNLAEVSLALEEEQPSNFSLDCLLSDDRSESSSLIAEARNSPEVSFTWEEEQPSSFSTDYLASDDRSEFSSSSPKVRNLPEVPLTGQEKQPSNLSPDCLARDDRSKSRFLIPEDHNLPTFEVPPPCEEEAITSEYKQGKVCISSD